MAREQCEALDDDEGHKRQHVSANSTGTTTTKPEIKRFKLAEPVVLQDAYHGLGLPYDTINFDEQQLLHGANLEKSESVPHDFELWANVRRDMDDPETANISLNLTQDVDGFPAGAICELKRVADFLDAMNYRADAFALYVLILKRLKMSNCPDWMIQWTTIACAYNAQGANQLEIVQTLLNQRLESPSASAFLAERFVMRMLLVDTYAWGKDFMMQRSQERIAKDECPDMETMLDNLSPDNRTLDLWTYHFLTRSHGPIRIHTDRKSGKKSQSPSAGHVRDPGATSKMTFQQPGPFELDPDSGEFGNPVMLSCLRWMAHELPRTKIDAYQASHLAKLKYSKRPFNTTSAVILWALWGRWQNGESTAPPEAMLWTLKAEKLMGISAATVLAVCLRTALFKFLGNHNAPYPSLLGQPDVGPRVLDRIRVAVEGLIQQGLDDPEALAADFMARYSNSRTNEVRSDSQSARFRNAARSHVKAYIWKSMKIELADFIFDNAAASRYRAARVTYNVVTSALMPTRASSMTQSDRASMRSFRERLAKGVHTAAQYGRPSSVYREQESMFRGLMNMSEMSLALPHSTRTSITMSTYAYPRPPSVLSIA